MNKASRSMVLDKGSEKYINIFDVFAGKDISLYFDESEKKFSLDKYTVYYSNKLAALQTLEEVFINSAYYFRTDEISPFIIDAGSEVGIAMLFFKIFYPKAKILCFEPHPYAFSLLQKNIEVNKFDDVIAINAALTGKEGVVDFFGEVDSVDPDVRGSSIIKAWGLQRETCSAIQVKAVKLSAFIDSKVHYLKLNVEGAEQQILEELKDKLTFVDKLLIKFHHSQKMHAINDLDAICNLLLVRGFFIKSKVKKESEQIFPDVTKGWSVENNAQLYTLFAEKYADSQALACLENNAVIELQEKIRTLKTFFLEREMFLLRNIIDNVQASVYWKDKAGNYLGHSAYAVQQLRDTGIDPGATVKNIIGKSDYDVFTKEIANKYRENDLYVMQNKKGLILEEVIVMPNGQELVQLSSKKPLYDEKGEVTGIIGSTIDITGRKRAEELEISNKIAQVTADKAVAIAGYFAHETRTPLASIHMGIQEITRAINSLNRDNFASQIEHIKNHLERVNGAIKGGVALTDTLLTNLRTVLGGSKINRNNFGVYSISKCITNVVKYYPYVGDEKNRVFWSVEQNDDFTFEGDKIYVEHALTNLVKNALYALRGHEDGNIFISLRSAGDRNELIFRDTGHGMSKEVFERVFSDFNTGHSTHGGTGLGLSFCKMVMDSMGGNIQCVSEINKGTEFVLSFRSTGLG